MAGTAQSVSPGRPDRVCGRPSAACLPAGRVSGTGRQGRKPEATVLWNEPPKPLAVKGVTGNPGVVALPSLARREPPHGCLVGPAVGLVARRPVLKPASERRFSVS